MIGSPVASLQATVALVCPHCGGDLTGDACGGCGRRFARRAGFLDLRTTDSPEIDSAADLDLAERVAAAPGGFDEALQTYFAGRPAVSAAVGRRHRAHLAAERARARTALAELGGGPLLDVGCGLGRYVAEAARAGRTALGADVSAASLAVARKLLAAEGLDATLILASAEALPFPDRAFGAIVATDLLEHLPDPARAVAEISRVLAPGGRWLGATPNRYSLTPEPHVGLWGLGWIPRSWAVERVRRKFGADYSTIRPFSLGRLERLLDERFDGECRVAAARLEPEELAASPPLKRALGRAYNRVAGLPPARRLAPYWRITGRRAGTMER